MKENGIYKYNDMGYNTYDLENGTLLYFDGSDGDLKFFNKLDGTNKQSYCLTLEEVIYVRTWEQHRLERVLSEMNYQDGEGYFYENKGIWLEYNYGEYNDNKFRIGLFTEEVISLDTVESLIKDLERNE